jgi:hypothetical protein
MDERVSLFPKSLLEDLKRLTRMVVVVIDPKSQSPPIRITPPWIIIGIGWVIVYRSKIDLFARNDRISIIHIAERFELFSYDFSCHSDLFPSPEDIRI